MSLASGADVSIGGVEFDLEWSADEPYAQNFESLYSDTQQIIGLDAQTANPNILLWSHDDWAGGAENKYYSEEIADSYWYGNANPRIRGSVTSVPDTGGSTGTLATGSATEWHVVQTGGKIWAGANRDLFYSTDGMAWSQWNSTSLFASGYTIHGITHDGYFPIVWADNGTTVKITKVTSTTTSTAFVSDITNSFRTYGAAMLEGSIYFWTGKQLLQFDSTATLPITYAAATHAVHTPFDAAATGTYNAGIAASENSIVYFTAAAGASHVFEYRYAASTDSFVPRPIWTPSIGFTASHITASMGVIYVLGDWGDQAALFGMSMVNREPLFLSYVGQAYGGNGATITPRGLTPSYAAQVLMAIDDGTTTYLFVYDAEIDSISQLDTLAIATHGTTYAVRTFKNRRLSFGNKADTTARFRYWKTDFDTPTGAWELISSAYHIGYPMDEKILTGFQVVQDPTIAAGTVQVYYQIDESGSWVNAGTTAAGVKYTELDLSGSNVKYRILRTKLVGASGARLFSLTSRSYVNAYQRTWRLVLKLNDDTDATRPSNRKLPGWKQADALTTLATTKSIVTFINGAPYPPEVKPGDYNTHTVVVEFPRYGGIRLKGNKLKGQGSAEIILRDVRAH